MIYTCDWPGGSGDGTCGLQAAWFIDGGGCSHRPLCQIHFVSGAKRIEEVDPAKVPGRMVPRDLPRSLTETGLRVENLPPKYGSGVPRNILLEPPEPDPPSTPSRPPLRDALVDVAVELCELAKRRLRGL
jgi:hypothetical protein